MKSNSEKFFVSCRRPNLSLFPLTKSNVRVLRSNANKEDSSVSVLEEYEDDEKPADVVGAKFFGGNAQKDDLYDPVAEAEAGIKLTEGKETQNYDKFEDPVSFPDRFASDFAMKLQAEINDLIDGKNINESMFSGKYMRWETPFVTDKSLDPLKALQNAIEFYNSLQVAILSAKSDFTSEEQSVVSMEIRWLISVLWPNAWESRAVLSGTSQITFDTASSKILSQKDSLDDKTEGGKDIIGALSKQLTPRFWDLYHIGMSPSAELMQRLPPTKGKGLFSSYELFEIAPRLVYRPTIIDSGGRDMRAAQAIPNHSFTTAIRTMGPKKVKFVPTSPIEISIQRSQEKGANVITWSIPVATTLSKSSKLPLPVLEDDELDIASACYEFQPRRRVATLPFGGYPQDSEVSSTRKKLYESVLRDGFKPKMGEDGKPCFFFLQNDAKACFVENGLGMAVYEWQPKFVDGNEVGIELEL